MIAITASPSVMFPVDQLKPFPGNPWNGDQEAIDASLEEFGQVEALVVNKPTLEVLGGNHRYAKFVEDGVPECLVQFVDLDPMRAKALNIRLNRVSQKGKFNDGELEHILATLDDFALAGFTIDDYENLIAHLDKVEETPYQEFQGGYAETPEETAARGEGRVNNRVAAGLKEIVLVYANPEADRFFAALKIIKEKLGTETTSSTVLAVMEEMIPYFNA